MSVIKWEGYLSGPWLEVYGLECLKEDAALGLRLVKAYRDSYFIRTRET